eukprot:255701-Rhodomonas_salina.1
MTLLGFDFAERMQQLSDFHGQVGPRVSDPPPGLGGAVETLSEVTSGPPCTPTPSQNPLAPPEAAGGKRRALSEKVLPGWPGAQARRS